MREPSGGGVDVMVIDESMVEWDVLL